MLYTQLWVGGTGEFDGILEQQLLNCNAPCDGDSIYVTWFFLRETLLFKSGDDGGAS